ncbi:hypothetical protein V6C42_14860 [Pseudoclostridium thermosuccinogenes]|jgi:hypothetical protein|uniref:hypothetical protein n=1 Tax=Clostridium thermosuccinogenes TaxID=84032 RepID=UPI000CCC10B3|nr:hypothetical protein [Pseudoclostridium thermosuccinogenes]PNT90896.1 hypothetical protein CDQ83_13730 [Pseudoclostridium thermosuccinogenes]
MISWISDVWQKILEIVNGVGSTMDELVTRLDAVQFDEDFIITTWLGTIHYILGTPLYLMFTTLLLIGSGFVLWKLIKIVINAISSLIPGLKGKVRIE